MTQIEENERKTGQCEGVLIVDDDPVLCEVMRELFSSLGYEPLIAGDGEAACDLLQGSNLVLVVVDLAIPKIDGFSLLKHLGHHPRTVDVPVIILTSSDDRASIEEAYRLGAASFVTKPINWVQFAYHAKFVIRSGLVDRNLRRTERAALNASRSKSGLFRVLSHELKTPLVAIIGLIELLTASLSDRATAKETEQFSYITQASHQLNNLISDILILSKAYEGKDSLRLSCEPMADLLEDSILTVVGLAREKKIRINITRPSKDLMVVCDVELLRQALLRLVNNAVKFSLEGGTVEIWAHSKDDRSIVISVRDNGPGISTEKLTECLQSFAKEDMTQGRRLNGVGLGLPIAQSIAEAHSGELICHSSPGQGFVAAIWIPELGLG